MYHINSYPKFEDIESKVTRYFIHDADSRLALCQKYIDFVERLTKKQIEKGELRISVTRVEREDNIAKTVENYRNYATRRIYRWLFDIEHQVGESYSDEKIAIVMGEFLDKIEAEMMSFGFGSSNQTVKEFLALLKKEENSLRQHREKAEYFGAELGGVF